MKRYESDPAMANDAGENGTPVRSRPRAGWVVTLSGLALGRGGESAAEKRAWTNQKRIGEALGKSAIAIGKLLDQHGLRQNKRPTQKALESGLAKLKQNQFGEQVLWHQAKVIDVIGTG